MFRNQWYWQDNIFIVLFVWLLVGSQTLKAQDDGDVLFKLKSHNKVYVCGNESDKRVQVSLNIGEVKHIDSLYSFDIIIKYDTTKLRINNILTINTLSEYFEYDGFSIVEPGFLRLYAAQFYGPPVSGDKPLVAFEAKYLNDCPDTIEIMLDDAEIEVTSEFLSKLNFDSAFVEIPVEVKSTATSYVECRFLSDTLSEFSDDSTVSVIMNLNTNNLERVDSIRVNLSMDENDNIVPLKIVNLSEEVNILDESVENVDEKILTTLDIKLDSSLEDENIFELVFRKNLNRDDLIKLEAKIEVLNECSCASDFRGDNLFIKTSEVVSVDDFEKNENIIDYKYFNKNDIVEIYSEDIIKEIKIYNVLGRMLDNRKYSDSTINYNMYSLNDGIYIVRVRLISGEIKNIIMIKN